MMSDRQQIRHERDLPGQERSTDRSTAGWNTRWSRNCASTLQTASLVAMTVRSVSFRRLLPLRTDFTSAYATRVDTTCWRIHRTGISSAGRSATDSDEAGARPRAEFVHQLFFTLSRQSDNFGHQPRERIYMTPSTSSRCADLPAGTGSMTRSEARRRAPTAQNQCRDNRRSRPR